MKYAIHRACGCVLVNCMTGHWDPGVVHWTVLLLKGRTLVLSNVVHHLNFHTLTRKVEPLLCPDHPPVATHNARILKKGDERCLKGHFVFDAQCTMALLVKHIAQIMPPIGFLETKLTDYQCDTHTRTYTPWEIYRHTFGMLTKPLESSCMVWHMVDALSSPGVSRSALRCKSSSHSLNPVKYRPVIIPVFSTELEPNREHVHCIVYNSRDGVLQWHHVLAWELESNASTWTCTRIPKIDIWVPPIQSIK